ncbi:MAG: 3-deoxy-manno-octulosonate cytidylyltransferase [Pseudomonadota bacterium]
MSGVWIVIPARYASTRYPGKPLVALRGATGDPKPLVQRSWEAAMGASGIDRVVVATDDERIAEAARSFGAEVVMTSPDCANGTERCAEVAAAARPAPEIVVNLQGDAPLTPPGFVDALVAAMRADPSIAVATPVLACGAEALARFRADRAAGRVGGTTAVCDACGRALYFSKEVLPFGGVADETGAPVLHHVGVYAYRREALADYAGWAPGLLERAEGLEQLRFLEHGRAIHCVRVSDAAAEFWEVNNPEDVARVEDALAARKIA